MKYKILFFTAKTCSPCNKIKKIIQENNLLEQLNIKIIDIQENISIARNMSILKVPTFIKIDENGKVLKRHIGNLTLSQLKNF